MRRSRLFRFGLLAIGLALVAPSGSPRAGEILACFDRGALGQCERRALEHVGFKSVILQYVDPARTELGEGLARLLWREILESISDLRGAGVILAYDRGGEIESALGGGDLGVFLERDYHTAALAIAEQQDVKMAIWGAILEDGHGLYIQNFLTLRESEEDSWTTLSMNVPRMSAEPLRARLGRDRINLPPLRASRDDLFARDFITRCKLEAGCPDGIALRAGPSNDAGIVSHVPSGAKIRTAEMKGRWLRLKGEGPQRWINLYHLEVLAREIQFSKRRNVNLRAVPGGDVLARVDLDGAYTVLNARRHGQYQNPWYEIRAGGRTGWVAGRLASRRLYTFPSVHLIAGLYRYGRGQYDRAAREFDAYLSSRADDDRVTEATVLKFRAASRLAGGPSDPGTVRSALSDLDRAAELTPFDPGVYLLRALIGVGSPFSFEAAFTDLTRAVELDSRDPQARTMIRELERAIAAGAFDPLASAEALEAATQRLRALRR